MDTAKHLRQIQPSYIREILSAATSKDVISLAGGLPANDQFPLALIEPAIRDLSTNPSLFQYGETAGYRPLLEFLQSYYEIPPSKALMVCTGSQQGLDLIARAFLDPGDVVALEAPSYLGALQVFDIAQARIESVRQIDGGPDLDALERLFSSRDVKLFYAVPDFHNPTGVCWSLEARKKVAQLCRNYDVALIEDAPYRDLRFSGEALPMVSSFCPERAFVLRSFSKVAMPGIRLGVVDGPTEWLSPLIKVKQAADLHSSIPMQAALLALLSNEQFAEHVKALCGLYERRYNVMRSAIRGALPIEYSVETVQGGMFLWLKLSDLNSLDVAKSALGQGVAVVPSEVFYHRSMRAEPALRLNFSHESEVNLEEAIQRLSKVL